MQRQFRNNDEHLSYERKAPKISGFTKSIFFWGGGADINTTMAAILKIRQLPHNIVIHSLLSHAMNDWYSNYARLTSLYILFPARSVLCEYQNQHKTYIYFPKLCSVAQFIPIYNTGIIPTTFDAVSSSSKTETISSLIYCIVFIFFEIQKFIYTPPWEAPHYLIRLRQAAAAGLGLVILIEMCVPSAVQ
jgi:hypothetical protein